MKLLFLVKYFKPFDRGGSEWSTENLARQLSKKGHSVTIVTPNYGQEKKHSQLEAYEVIRIPFPIKVKNIKSTIAPYWTYNLVWFIYSTFYVLYLTLQKKYDIVHIQNNEFVPAGVAVASIRKIKSVVTFRDYQMLCPLGFCLWNKKKSCSLEKYRGDVDFFLKNYTQADAKTKIVVYISAYRAYFISKLVKEIGKRATVKVAVSKYVADIYKTNGIKNVLPIENAVDVAKPKASAKNLDTIVYVGKLSPGKGVDILMLSMKSVIRQLKKAKFVFVGTGLLKSQLQEYVHENNLQEKVLLLGQKSHEETLAIVTTAKLVVVPSTWPEPLPRSVIETLLLGKPVVATRSGGIPEVLNKQYGELVAPRDYQSLAKAIVKVYTHSNVYSRKIARDSKKLKSRFSDISVANYEKVYQG